MHLTPALVAQTYELLRGTPPFRRWGLPAAQDVAFVVLSNPSGTLGDYVYDNGHRIRVNGGRCASFDQLIPLVAHEMCHLKQQVSHPRDTAVHGSRFRRYAASVCRYHHFDPKAF
jgi:hypothetical protein